MAKKITEILIDDIDGTEIAEGSGETVRFSLDGVRYEIDLTDENAKQLRAAFEPFIAKGRKAGVPGSRATKPKSRASRDLSAVRGWLREQGHEVSDRGRIPANLVAEYEAAN